jgi:hypothetical protein
MLEKVLELYTTPVIIDVIFIWLRSLNASLMGVVRII